LSHEFPLITGCDNPAVTRAPLLFDLASRGSIVLTGKDRATFLHGLVTNDIKKLTPGTGCAAAFLTPKGKLLADCVVLCEEERLEVDCEPELAQKIEDLLRKYLVFNEVEIANETAKRAVFHLAGEGAGDDVEDLLRKGMGRGAGEPLPQSPHSQLAIRFPFEEKSPSLDASKAAGDEAGGAEGTIRIVRENRAGIPGWDLRLPSSLSKKISSSLLLSGAQFFSLDRLDALRIAAGIPRWGFELTEAVLPDEAGMRERGFISENKGCYIGQETVARIKTYGHVNRRLVLLSVSGGLPVRENEIFFEGEKTGGVTSVSSAPPADALALGFVKRVHAAPDARFSVRTPEGDLPAIVVSLPPG
jgi:tRNA-modifying protein YgfZ